MVHCNFWPFIIFTLSAGLAKQIVIAVGSRVMYLVNSPTTSGLVNGARGTVLRLNFARNRRTVSSVTVKFDDIAEPQQVTKIRKMIMPLSDCMVHRSQFPLVLAYAVTIHKSQSLTLPCVFADLGDAIFAAGQCNVALSRCKTLEGLYLLNFNPSRVYCSNRAVRQQARLLEMEESELPHNNPKSWSSAERVWYTKAYERMAKRAMKTDLKNEAEAKKSMTPKNSKKAKSTRTKGNNSLQKKDPVKIDQFQEPLVNATDQRKSKKDSRRNFAPKQTAGNADNNVIDVDAIQGQGEFPTQRFQYHPVDTVWQRRICEVFGWPYIRPSVPSIWPLPVEIDQFQAPIVKKIGADGNCYYRAISYVVTGSENSHKQVKRSIFRFMRQNIAVMKEIERSYTSYHFFHDYEAIDRTCMTQSEFNAKYPADTRIEMFLDYHEKDKVWANSVIMTWTAIMLKTNYQTFCQRDIDSPGPAITRNQWFVHQHRFEMNTDMWIPWMPIICHLEGDVLAPTSDQEIYLQSTGGAHFDAACCGIQGIHTS